MKRSKIFLVATTAILAVVGFVSAKAHKHFTSLTYYSAVNGCTQRVTAPAHKEDGGTAGSTQYGYGCPVLNVTPLEV